MSHPFLEGLTGGGDASHPFLAGLNTDGTDARLETATGRRLAQDENISTNITKLTELMNRPDTTPEHKARLKKIIAGMQRTDEGRINDKSNLPSPALGAGVVKGVMLPAQVTGALANLVGASKGQQLVDQVSEAEAGVDEAFPSRGTTDEKALEMMGTMASSAPGLGPLAELTGAPLAAAGAKVFPKVAKAIASATAAGGVKGAIAGAAKTVGKGLPLNYLFTRTQDDTGNPADKAKQMVVQAGADAIFGAAAGAAGHAKAKSSKPITPSEAKAAAQAEGVSTDLSAETQAALATQKAKTDATIARLETRKKAQRLARAEFELTNPDKKFNDLDKEVRKSLIDAKEQLLGVAATEGSGAAGTAAGPVVDEASLPPAARPDPGERLADYTPDPAVIARARAAEAAGLPMGESVANTNLNKKPKVGQPGFAAELANNPIRPVDPLETKLAELKTRVANGETATPARTLDASTDPIELDAQAEAAATKTVEHLKKSVKKQVNEKSSVDQGSAKAWLTNDETALEQHLAELTGGDAAKMHKLLLRQRSDFVVSGAITEKIDNLFGRVAGRIDAIHTDSPIPEGAGQDYRTGYEAARTELSPATTEPAISSPGTPAVTPGAEPPISSQAELTPKEIDKLKDQLFDRLDANPDDKAAIAELDKLAEITKQRGLNKLTPEERAKAEQINAENKAKKVDPVDLPLDQPVDETIPQMNPITEAPVEAKPTTRPEKDPEYVKLSSIPSRTKSTDQLKRFLDLADEYLQKLSKDGPDYKGVRSMMDKAATELAKRAKYDQGPVIAQMPPGVGGFVAGFTGGYVTTDDDADKVTNGLLWGLAGAAAAQYKFGRSVFHPEKPKIPLPAWEEAAAKKVINAADRSKQPMGLMALAQRAYQMTIRGTSGLDYFTDAMKATRLPAYKNPAKLASMRGEWLSRADGWIMGRPQTIEVDPLGVPQLVDLPVKSIKEIYDSVNGNTDKLGRVLVAYASNELRGRKSVPFDQVTSDLILGNAPEAFHQAARDIRQVHSALIDELVKADIISDAGRQKMLEEIAYAPLWKVFEQQSHIDAAGNNVIGSPNPVKARGKGSEAPVKNPYESTIEMIAKTLNNAEVNNIKRTTIDLAETNPKLAGGFIQRIRKGVNPSTPAIEARVAELKADIKGLSDADAQGLVTAFDQTPVSKNNIMTAFRNGVKQSYQLSDPLALTMRALNPAERPMWLELLGVPSHIARRGVTLHPWFVFMQAFRDTWQATMNSQYGFRFGIDSFVGWKNIVERSPAYREMTGAGGGNSIIQSRDFGNIQKSVESVQVGHGPNALVDAWRNLKELHPTKAYEQLIVPFAESARMGEYLRARGHGADVVDAVFAAKHVVGNFQQRGAAASMQALNHLTMFLNPALQATDQAFYRMGAHPFRTPEEGRTAAAANYLTKAFATLVVPSYLFWLANHDDQEITNIRQTPGGSRFWYMRSPVDAGAIKQGEIIRIPKPQGDGQLFGTSVETALDTWKGGDTEGASRLIDAVWGDMAPNILPQIGVLTAGIATNHDFGLGTPIVPKSSEGMEPAYQDTRNTPELMRIVSNQLNPMTKEFPNEGMLGAIKRASTPAGLQFIVNNLGGMLGVDAVRGISSAIQYNEKGLAPIKAEAPIVGRFFQKTPTMYVRSVRDFYSAAERVDEVANTITELTKTKPELLGPYIEENQQYLPLISIYGQARQEIANYTRALDDLELMSNGTDPKQIQLLKDEYQRLIIDATVRANSMAHAAKQ